MSSFCGHLLLGVCVSYLEGGQGVEALIGIRAVSAGLWSQL